MSDRQKANFDLDQLLHPARAFGHPSEVVHDPDLTLNEKRAILASWASDACAVEAAPDLRVTTSGRVVQWDDIMEALRTLDREADSYGRLPHYKRVLAKCRNNLRATSPHTRRSGSHGQMLN
ncbi:MAG: hypothetical protein P8Y71_24340 [Pseudolabrys sp.]|jgi:hypothetical protein